MKYRPRRKPTDFHAVLITEHDEVAVVVCDAGETGVKVRVADARVEPDELVDLKVHNNKLAGRVSWVEGEFAGVKMNRPIPKDVVTLITRGMRGGRRMTGPVW